MLKFITLCASSLLCLVSATVNKTRLCVEYAVSNHWAEEEALLLVPGLTQSRCMARCVRQPLCRAFNFRSTDGTCRLHPESPPCMTLNTTEGWLYVALSSCSQYQPWHSMRPVDDGWQWITAKEPSVRNDILEFGGRLFCRIFYKGLYLPGWWGKWPPPGLYRVVVPHKKMVIKCMNGEFLVLPNSTRFDWIPVSTYPFPTNAVIGGYATDLTPLYVARRQYTRLPHPVPGIYNVVTEKFYVVYNGYTEETAGNISVLVPNWYTLLCNLEIRTNRVHLWYVVASQKE